MTDPRRLIAAVLALILMAVAGRATAQELAPAIVFDMGGKFDKSFNEAAYNGAERFKKETGIAYREFEVTAEAQREQALRNMARRGSQIVVGVGFSQASGMLSGAYLSIAHHASFIRDMSAGKGYLALAALIFGQWRPVPTVLACLLFAFADVVQTRLQGTPLPVVGVVPVQLIQAIPYVLTVGLLAGFVGRAVAPRAIGVPYVKDR
jgi:ABC-type uncharacterized transport system permease subunit